MRLHPIFSKYLNTASTFTFLYPAIRTCASILSMFRIFPFGACSVTATIVLIVFDVLRILEWSDILAKESKITLVGDLVYFAPYLTSSIGSSFITVDIPTKIASTDARNSWTRLRSTSEEILDSPDLVAILPSRDIEAL